MGTPLLEINNLTVTFEKDHNSFTAVKDLSLTVTRGQIRALVGESGSGKSVTSMSILKLIPSPPVRYKSGSIIFYQAQGTSIDLLQTSEREIEAIRGTNIAMIFQEPMTALNPVLTCGDQIIESILLHQKKSKEDATKEAIQLFTSVKINEPAAALNKYPHELSGGQKQRVMIAIAMSGKPDLLICDEPTTALDVQVQKSILQLLKELQQETGMGILFITHDLSVVASFADAVSVLYKGQVVEQNTTKEIFSNPSHPYTKALLACRPGQYPKGYRLPVVSDFLQIEAINHALSDESQNKVPATLSNKVLLAVNNVSIQFPIATNIFGKITKKFTAVDNISFDIMEGETLGLVGQSGCGKTTLGRSIVGLQKINEGHISFKGETIVFPKMPYNKNYKKVIQLIFQDPYSSLNPNMRIGDAIAEPLKVHGNCKNDTERKAQVIEMLEKVELAADQYNKYPHEFSGGQRQRIVIARALILKPKFVICDESVSALDVSVQAQVLNLLNDLKASMQFSALFITHDLSVVKYISDRIMVMNKGKIEEIGPAETVYNSPKSLYTQELLAALP
jgi:peptide/nickel transport system ATP-binding protein